ncbi:MAG TPA: DUF1330 domain-containing protein [Candidatus Saccharimonadales bacterium]|nr:DUF1330 domain-containing protein [Candidatus Saccharimonadales bacterium]
MAAYVIVDIEVTDPGTYERYKQLAAPAVAAFGGRYLARGGRALTLEGEWAPSRLVILEFPTLERAQQWLGSPEYREARGLRHAAARSRMVAVEGVAGI